MHIMELGWKENGMLPGFAQKPIDLLKNNCTTMRLFIWEIGVHDDVPAGTLGHHIAIDELMPPAILKDTLHFTWNEGIPLLQEYEVIFTGIIFVRVNFNIPARVQLKRRTHYRKEVTYRNACSESTRRRLCNRDPARRCG